ARPSVRQISGLDGDSLVMLSDGISEGEYPYIRQLLQQGLPLKEITRTICEKAAVFNGGQVRDDMTVIAARIRTENLSDMTKSDREATYQHGRFALSTS
ncbi:MAG: serine/threonine-protein phosphatase, partial [Oscillospiraceae bacterium]|nr:serine/threonine-protein phosphatase [Oscillospiraceae bacterium]